MVRSYVGGAFAVLAALVLAACAHSAPAGPPTENGVYIARGVCFGEGECNRYWRASKPVDLHAQPDPAAPVVATIAADEWVEAVDGQLRLRPLRGVVHTATTSPPLAVGDVVYMLEPQGEGFYTLWGNGKMLEHDWAEGDANEPITWDAPAPAAPGLTLGWWVQLKRADGRTGWVKDPAFECMGALQGSADCRD